MQIIMSAGWIFIAATAVNAHAIATSTAASAAAQFSTKIFSTQELESKSLTDLYLLRNLIFGHHCYSFTNKHLHDYTNVVLGPRTCSTYVKDIVLTPIEKENIALIERAEREVERHVLAKLKESKSGEYLAITEHGEHCLLANLFGPNLQLICLASIVVNEDSLILLRVDGKYRALNKLGDYQFDGVPPPPSYFLIRSTDSTHAYREVEVSEYGSYIFDGKQIMTPIEKDIEAYSLRRPTGDEKAVEKTAREFYARLHERKYDEAEKLYGGTYETLHYWNPQNTGNNAELLRAGCEGNGLQCIPLLTVHSIKSIAGGTYDLIVEFTRDGQEPWVPCTDLGSPPPDSKVHCKIQKRSNSLLVMDLPPYCP